MKEQIDNLNMRVTTLEGRIDALKDAIGELIHHAQSNTEAIVEHIAQLDSEKEEILNEFRVEVEQISKNG